MYLAIVIKSKNFYVLQIKIINPVTKNYFIDSSPIKEVPHSKYLGVIIDNKLSWNPHTQHMTNKAIQVNDYKIMEFPFVINSINILIYCTITNNLIIFVSYS